MNRSYCEQEEAPAPRQGCSCRACYRCREGALDPRLIELVREDWTAFPAKISPARHVARKAVDMYLTGRIEWAALYIEIIRALIEQSDEQFNQALSLVNTLPGQPPVVLGPPIFLDKP